jgi:fibronectin type 3 domain-containing protein
MFDTSGLPRADVKVTPISSGDDGTQIWKITHNGVDTHPIHFHAYDVQVLNRVTWDNIIKPPHPTELGWKETVRVSPLEDTYVAMRPIIPVLPFDFPNSIRLLSPMMPEDAWIANTTLAEQLGLPMLGFAPNGEPIDIVNHYVNYGAEYVYHCHILSHEEMDMMHAVALAFPPVAPSGLAFNAGTLMWTDNSLSETAFVVEKSVDGGVSWAEVGWIERPLLAPNTTGEVLDFAVSEWLEGDQYRVVAQNTVGDTWDYSDVNLNEIAPNTYAFPVITTESVSEVLDTTPPPAPQPPAAPSDLTATQAGLQVSLAWTDNATNETGFVIERATDGGGFSLLATVGADTTSYLDTAVTAGSTYDYQVAAVNDVGTSAYSNTASVTVVEPPAPPLAPTDLEATLEDTPRVDLVWVDNSTDETGFVIERATDGVNFSTLTTVGADTTAYADLAVSGGNTYDYRVAAVNAGGLSAYSNTASVPVPADVTIPAAPSNLAATNVTPTSLTLNWQDNSVNEDGFTIERAKNSSFTKNLATFDVGPNVTSYDDSGLTKNTKYYYRVSAFNVTGASPWSPILNVITAK